MMAAIRQGGFGGWFELVSHEDDVGLVPVDVASLALGLPAFTVAAERLIAQSLVEAAGPRVQPCTVPSGKRRRRAEEAKIGGRKRVASLLGLHKSADFCYFKTRSMASSVHAGILTFLRRLQCST